jgi:hypothetical protein
MAETFTQNNSASKSLNDIFIQQPACALVNFCVALQSADDLPSELEAVLPIGVFSSPEKLLINFRLFRISRHANM